MGWNCPTCGIQNEMSKMVCSCGYKASIESDLMEIAKESEINKSAAEGDNPNFLLALISFFIPLIGFILGIVFVSKAKEHDKTTGSVCLIASVVGFIVGYFWLMSIYSEYHYCPVITQIASIA